MKNLAIMFSFISCYLMSCISFAQDATGHTKKITWQTTIEDEILNALTSGHVTVDTIGQALHMLRNTAISGATANSIMARIDEAISAAKNIKRTTTNATYVHANVTTEEDVVEFIGLNNDVELNMDCILLTQNATVRVRERVDGITYEIIQEQTSA